LQLGALIDQNTSYDLKEEKEEQQPNLQVIELMFKGPNLVQLECSLDR
jgi:hypothetical protein